MWTTCHATEKVTQEISRRLSALQATQDQGKSTSREDEIEKLTASQCDEIHPRCGNCAKHGVSCDFDPSYATASTPAASIPTSSSTTPIPPPAAPTTTDERPPPLQPSLATALVPLPGAARVLELKLVHHFSVKTARSLAPRYSQQTRQVWEEGVPELAFHTPYLLNALLAVAALHLRTLEPQNAALIRACHGYMASALAQYSALLAVGVHAANAEAMFLTGTLIAFQISASRRFTDEMDGRDAYALPVPWFHAFQGLKALVLESWVWLRESNCVMSIVRSQPAVTLDMSRDRPRMFDVLLEDIDGDLELVRAELRHATRQAYEHAVAYLTWAAQREPEQGSVLAFPATVSRRFVELVEQKDPRALCITACFFAMTRACDDVWWLQDAGRREVRGLMSCVPPDWWPRMSWAIRVTDWEGPIDETIWGFRWKTHSELSREEVDLNAHIDILAQVAALAELTRQM